MLELELQQHLLLSTHKRHPIFMGLPSRLTQYKKAELFMKTLPKTC